jgi:predicted lipoprotein with Yx(FWY)xxD motif
MTRSRPVTRLVFPALVAVGALAVAACGSSGSSASKNASTTIIHRGAATPPASRSASSGTVDAASSSLGKILVDSHGRTLYLWQADTGPMSTCSGACAAAWPPLLSTGTPTAGNGAKASLLGTTKRSGGEEQVTYNQHPLYHFAGDTAPGQTNGQGSTGFGALWYVVSPGGNQITGPGSASGSASGASASTGY